ncbi:MAG: hypothetical protein HHAS10_04280 [Candidatus Altimarinota bacterium]
MFSFKKIISLYSIFGILFFLGLQIINASKEGNYIFLGSGSSGFITCSNFDIHCEKIDDSTIVCESNGNLGINHQTNLREIPFGTLGYTGYFIKNCLGSWSSGVPKSIGKNYKNPDPFIYPFVKIIKIQV